ncbi:MAG TPA: metal-dependent transcriptional regulator [Planctomycetota bacterium]|nr:metal-dependent transcriptional regulator [Planctomycetota bacterium]
MPSVAHSSSIRERSRGALRRLSANMEDYLETIYRLTQEHGVSRVSSIAAAMGVKKPSVSKALKRLQRDGLVTHAPYGGATVTARGQKVAQAQVRSHRALTRFLVEVLALEPELAEHDACQIEHAISQETVERLVEFIDFLERHGKKPVSKFRQGLKRNEQESSRKNVAAGRTWTSRV